MEEIKKDKEVEKQNTNKVSKIDIILTVITLLLIIVPGAIALKYYIEEKEREELLTVGYTEHNLTRAHLKELSSCLDICPPEYRDIKFYEKYMYNPEKKELELEPGKYADRQIKRVNELIFNNPDAELLKAEAEKYGFSKTNPITIEWVLENPKEMFDILFVDAEVLYLLDEIELSIDEIASQYN